MIGARLREARESAGMKGATAAKEIGCDRSYLSKLESGTARNPSADFLRKAAHVYGVNEHWLESGIADARTPISSREHEELEQDLQFLSAMATLIKQMTVSQLLRAAVEIGDNDKITDGRKGFWIRLLGPWIAVKGRNAEEQNRAINFELARARFIQNKCSLMADSEESHWQQLRERAAKATEQRGSRAALARLLGVSPQALNEWLQGRSTPPSEQTLRLLRWVEQAEVEQQKKRAGRAETRPAQATRKSKSTSHEKAKSGPCKKG